MKPTSTRERKRLAGDNGTQGFESLLRIIEIIRIQNHQRSPRSNGLPGGEASAQAAVAEFGVTGVIVDECLAECAAVEGFATGNIAHVEFDVVDLSVFAANTHACLLG